MELDSIEAAKKMVERGLGVALLPRHRRGARGGERHAARGEDEGRAADAQLDRGLPAPRRRASRRASSRRSWSCSKLT